MIERIIKHHFIINPAAGSGNYADELKIKIAEACEASCVEYLIYETKSSLDATRYVKAVLDSQDGTHRFYACGGDGTLSEVLNGTELSECAEIALIPIGTGNDFWKNFDNKEYFTDISRQINGVAQKIDVIKYNNKYCANMINIGFDSDVAKKIGALKQNPIIPNRMAYLTSVIITLFKKFGKKMHIELDDGTVINNSLLLTAVANGQFCGGGYDAAPKAKLNDGLMDFCIVEKISRLQFLRLVPKYKKGTHLETAHADKLLRYIQTTGATYSFDELTDVCIDGEIEQFEQLHLSIVRDAISFSIPQGCKISDKSSVTSAVGDEADIPAT